MTTYYYETSGLYRDKDYGQYEAENDGQAIAMMPEGTIILYRESDTPDGTPFIVVWTYCTQGIS